MISVKIKDGKILLNRTASRLKPKLGVEIRKLVEIYFIEGYETKNEIPSIVMQGFMF
jgi:hypothetical protein